MNIQANKNFRTTIGASITVIGFVATSVWFLAMGVRDIKDDINEVKVKIDIVEVKVDLIAERSWTYADQLTWVNMFAKQNRFSSIEVPSVQDTVKASKKN